MGIPTEPRNCLRGHGPMTRQADLYGLPQFRHEPLNPLAAAIGQERPSHGPGHVTVTGKVYTVLVYTCRVCGQVELVDAA